MLFPSHFTLLLPAGEKLPNECNLPPPKEGVCCLPCSPIQMIGQYTPCPTTPSITSSGSSTCPNPCKGTTRLLSHIPGERGDQKLHQFDKTSNIGEKHLLCVTANSSHRGHGHSSLASQPPSITWAEAAPLLRTRQPGHCCDPDPVRLKHILRHHCLQGRYPSFRSWECLLQS